MHKCFSWLSIFCRTEEEQHQQAKAETSAYDLLNDLSNKSIEARYRLDIQQSHTLVELEPAVLETCKMLCQYHGWSLSALERHFRSAKWHIWLYAMPVDVGSIALNPATKFQKRFSIKCFLGSEQEFKQRLTAEPMARVDLEDAGFQVLDE